MVFQDVRCPVYPGGVGEVNELPQRSCLGEGAQKLYAGGRKRRSPIVGDRAPHSQALVAHGLGLRVLPALQLPLDGPHASIALFELLFSVPVGLVDFFGCLTQVVELA